MRRTIFAFVFAPIVPSLIPAWFYHLTSDVLLISMWVLFCLVFYVLQIVIGIPAYLFFTRLEAHGVWMYMALGFAAVILPAAIATALTWRSQQNFDAGFLLYMALYLGALGAGTALIFWILARPDRRIATASQSS